MMQSNSALKGYQTPLSIQMLKYRKKPNRVLALNKYFLEYCTYIT